MGDVEKSSFYCFARQRGPQWANALKIVIHPGVGSEEFYSVQGAGHDQLMDTSWIHWHHEKVSSIINFSGFNQSRVYVLVVSSFHLEGVHFL